MTEERRRLVVPPQGSPCGGATPVVVVAIMGVSWRGSWRPDSCAAPAGTRRSSLSSSPTGTRAMHGTMRARVYDRDHLDHYDLDLLVDDVALPRAAGRRTAMPRTSTDRWTSCSLSDCAEEGRPPVATIILVLENDDQRGMANVKVFCDCDDVTIERADAPPQRPRPR